MSGARKRKLRRERRLAGVCSECGSVSLFGESTVLCEEHWFKKMARTHLGAAFKWKALQRKFYGQSGLCAYSGLKLFPGRNASVDHIYPQSKYPALRTRLSNVEWVDVDVNRMKGTMTPVEFFIRCKMVVTNREGDECK